MAGKINLQVRKFIFIVIITVMATFRVPFDVPTSEARDEKVVIIVSENGVPFSEALAGFQQVLRKQAGQGGWEIYQLEGDPANAAQAVQKAKKTGAGLVFTLGSLATEAALKEMVNTYVIAGLVLRADVLKKAPNATGVILEFSFETQFKWMHNFFPNIRTIGVIYNSMENQGKIEAAAIVAERMGLKLETQKIQVPQDLPHALERIAKRADVLWGVADSLVLTPQTAKQVLLFSFQNHIPFVGLSSAWVKAGAFYSLDWDYKDLGMQCGEMALKILQGTPAGALTPATPRKLIYSVNLNTARHMKIEVPEALRRNAHSLF